ncbi:phosphatidylglycerophosphatase A [Aestuariibacter sp. AA17]|uniref:Phosphatidylglycerophosphatase A n=1 Tax=Fluctibacter corallii TaxID=2984329 RepID=A0ABT3A3M5_9ALTE|nr:phosphatidylglycerophosphatase A [Aestuariibacter sp. AA17]MCV2883217.1 phosphatidylglycerophosphatase A [Aestuariibacter sp. AA17]
MDSLCREKVSLRNPVHLLALGFGTGLAPLMPGTVGTLAAFPLIWLAVTYLSLTGFVTATIAASLVGIYLCGKTAIDMEVHDHSGIVWDEVAGMMIAMIAVPFTWKHAIVAFVLFRIFDIIKPWPISYFDKHVHGGFGIMIDDIIAGLFALGCMHGLLSMGWL